MIKAKLVPLFVISGLLLSLNACDDTKASIDVVKKKLTGTIQDIIGKGDLAIQKYENKIESTREDLIKLKVSKRLFQEKIGRKKTQLDKLNGSTPPDPVKSKKVKILGSAISDMEKMSKQLVDVEAKLENALTQMVRNLDLVKIKVEVLEAKRAMMEAIRQVEGFAAFETDIGTIGKDVNSAIEGLKEETYKVEAEIEVNKLLNSL
jgi:hypothetical protein